MDAGRAGCYILLASRSLSAPYRCAGGCGDLSPASARLDACYWPLSRWLMGVACGPPVRQHCTLLPFFVADALTGRAMINFRYHVVSIIRIFAAPGQKWRRSGGPAAEAISEPASARRRRLDSGPLLSAQADASCRPQGARLVDADWFAPAPPVCSSFCPASDDDA